jgi:pyridoxal phosphate phosphatase PHOSPHO2
LVVKLFERGITRSQIIEVFENLPLTPAMSSTVRLLHSKGYDLRIVSDANTIYIDTILKVSGITNVFSDIRTNPAHFDDRGCLIIGPYEKSPEKCPNGCPSNMCKGKVMVEYFKTRAYARAVYIGDGSGDFCACTKLREGDVALVRSGNPLEKLVKSKAQLVLATVVFWDSGKDVLKFFEEFSADSK